MILTGRSIHLKQFCKRKYKIESEYRYLPWHASTLFSACMRQALLALSNSVPLPQAMSNAVGQFTSNCVRPGLDSPPGVDTYSLAMDYCTTIRTILTWVGMAKLPPLKLKEPVQATPDVTWGFLSFEESNPARTLHRFTFSDSIGDTARLREAHSWELFGDLVLSRSPMILHMISIGSRDGSHLVTPWCHAYKSPLTRQLRFQKKSGKNLKESWTPFYATQDQDPSAWVAQMMEDGITLTLSKNYNIGVQSEPRLARFLQDLALESSEIALLDSTPLNTIPLQRPMCDSPYSCQHQEICYSDDPEKELASSGLYERINSN